MKFIPTHLHGALDYVFGFTLILSPHALGFAETEGPERLVPQVIGLFILVQGLMTRYECGVLRVLRMSTHLFNESLAALFLALSPWVFDFNAGLEKNWLPHFVVGLAMLLGCLLTRHEQRAVFQPAI
jgi:hypothetical protein